MRNTAIRSFEIVVAAAAGLTIVALAVTVTLEINPPGENQLHVLWFVLGMFKVILAGFVVTMLGILIPAVGSEARQRFEQRKESRIAYSEAKTGIDYLKLRLATANLSEATIAIRNAHFHKHLAELFEEHPEWLRKRYGPEMTPGEWDEMMYGRLFGARQVLEKNAETWDRMVPRERIALLDHTLPTIFEGKKKHPPDER